MYKEFKAIYKQEFGVNLTDEEAHEKGMRLLTLAKAIIIHKQNKKVKTDLGNMVPPPLENSPYLIYD